MTFADQDEPFMTNEPVTAIVPPTLTVKTFRITDRGAVRETIGRIGGLFGST